MPDQDDRLLDEGLPELVELLDPEADFVGGDGFFGAAEANQIKGVDGARSTEGDEVFLPLGEGGAEAVEEEHGGVVFAASEVGVADSPAAPDPVTLGAERGRGG
jgi:hypothetical protein